MRHHVHDNPSPPRTRRGGFTMIELLVVIAIMVILVGISVALVVGAGGTAREEATRGTIEKIRAQVQSRRDALDRSITKGPLAAQVRTLAASGGVTEEVARIRVRKDQYKRAFPFDWVEAQALGLGTYAGDEIARNTTSDADNAEVLYWTVLNGGTFGAASVGDDTFTANEVGDTDSDGNLEFLDGWGTPIRFYRWPTRLVRPDGTNVNLTAAELLWDSVTTANAGSDPDDPKGKLTVLVNETNYHTPNTYHQPLIVSAGADLDFGLYAPNDTANFGHLAQPEPTVLGDPGNSALNDNFTNLQSGGN